MSNFLKLNKVNFYTKNFNKQTIDDITYLWKN